MEEVIFIFLLIKVLLEIVGIEKFLKDIMGLIQVSWQGSMELLLIKLEILSIRKVIYQILKEY